MQGASPMFQASRWDTLPTRDAQRAALQFYLKTVRPAGLISMALGRRISLPECFNPRARCKPSGGSCCREEMLTASRLPLAPCAISKSVASVSTGVPKAWLYLWWSPPS